MTLTPKAKELKQKEVNFRKTQEFSYVIGTEILHFDQLEAPKNEFEVCESHLQSLKSGYMEFLSNFIKLQNQFSQLSVGQNTKFLCLSNRKFS